MVSPQLAPENNLLSISGRDYFYRPDDSSCQPTNVSKNKGNTKALIPNSGMATSFQLSPPKS